MGPIHWIREWGLAYGIYPWVSGGGGEEELQGTTAETFSQDDASSKQPCLCYILYIAQWRFRCSMRQTVANGDPDPRYPGQTSALFQDSTTRRPSPRTEDGEGVVAPRSVTDSTEKWV